MSKKLVDHYKLIPDVCHTRWYEEKDLLSSWKQLIFEMFVSIDLLGPKEMILSFVQYLSKYIADPDNLLPDIRHVR